MKKKLLITGAYGLVGSAICRLLDLRKDLEISKVKFDQLEVSDAEGGFDYVIHAAGYGQPQMFLKDKILTINMNTEGIQDLISLMKKDGKFLFISTSEVYSGANPPYREEDIGNTTPQHPRACYIEGKRCGEAIVMAYREQGYDAKIARLALAYGPGTKVGDTRVINQLIEQALTIGRIKLLDDGSAKRTYVYVDDAAEMMLDVLFEGKEAVYNVGGFSETTILDLAHTIAAMTGADVVIGDKPLEGAPENVRLDMTKTLTEFPRDLMTLTDGLFNTIAYQRKLYGK
jgi:nucleoside-diphosphate-sugar epimerase